MAKAMEQIGLIRGVLGVVLFLVFGGSVAQATTVGFAEGDGRTRADRYFVKGDSGPDEIDVRYDAAADAFLISANDRITTTVCTEVDQNAVSCEASHYYLRIAGHEGNDRIAFDATGAGFSVVQVYAGDGEDRLRGEWGRLGGVRLDGDKGADRVVGLPGEQDLDGGPGADLVIGGSGRDYVAGGPGNDVIRGGPGADVLTDAGGYGDGSGKDDFFGGPGNDELDTSEDEKADGRIDCGRGPDDMLRHDQPDPQPIACEEVRLDSELDPI